MVSLHDSIAVFALTPSMQLYPVCLSYVQIETSNRIDSQPGKLKCSAPAFHLLPNYLSHPLLDQIRNPQTGSLSSTLLLALVTALHPEVCCCACCSGFQLGIHEAQLQGGQQD